MRLNPFTPKALAAAALWALAAASAAWAVYPDKPIRIVVTFAAGGASDIVARVIAEPLGKALGTAVIVDNKPGAGGTLDDPIKQVTHVSLLGVAPVLIMANPRTGPATLKDLPKAAAAPGYSFGSGRLEVMLVGIRGQMG